MAIPYQFYEGNFGKMGNITPKAGNILICKDTRQVYIDLNLPDATGTEIPTRICLGSIDIDKSDGTKENIPLTDYVKSLLSDMELNSDGTLKSVATFISERLGNLGQNDDGTNRSVLDYVTDINAISFKRMLDVGDDPNNLLDYGIYGYTEDIYNTTITADNTLDSHFPFSNAVIEVFGTADTTSQKIQRAYQYIGEQKYAYRSFNNNAWSEWIYNNYLPLTGGSLDGSLAIKPAGQANLSLSTDNTVATIQAYKNDQNKSKFISIPTEDAVSPYNKLQYVDMDVDGKGTSERYDIIHTGNKNLITLEDIGALGFKRILTTSDDLDNIIEPGVYRYNTNNQPNNTPYSNASVIEVFYTGEDTTGILQRVTRYGAAGFCSIRGFSQTNGWCDWTEFATTAAATTAAAGLMSAADKTKLDNITTDADSVAFSQALTSGTKVGTITINGIMTDLYAPTDTNTTYSNFVKSGSGAKAGLVPAPPNTAGSTKYLREDGTWVVPPDTNTTYSAATQSAAGLMSAADKTKLDGIFANADNVTFTQALTSGTKVGEITINGTKTTLYAPTNTDTHYTTNITAGASATTTNAATTNPYIKIKDDSIHRSQIQLKGGGATTVTSDANGVITISSTDTNTDTDTKNTAGSTNNTGKLFLIGAPSQVTNSLTYSNSACYVTNGVLTATQVIGAVYNDYAEYRQVTNTLEPGRVVIENGDDTLRLSETRMQLGGNIISDTFGFSIGQNDNCNVPIAVSGRVLAYPYEDRESYIPGEPVCTGPNGTVSKMTREEIRDYPECIIGTVSSIPNYDVWGSNNVSVNGRIWIKVK